MNVSKFLGSAFFFFSSRRRHTRFDCDWSSDVCSSDLSFRASPRGRDACRFRRLRRARASAFLAAGLERRGLRSEEHTSELQSQSNLVCRLLLEKKKTHTRTSHIADSPHAGSASYMHCA